VKGNVLSVALAPAAVLFCLSCNAALAQERPAVSGLNGKFEFSAGALTLPTPTFVGRAAGALTIPLGNRFGLQADFSASTAPGFTTSAAVHVFARDPSIFLLGGSVGFVRSSGSLVVAAGPEAELYRDRWTVEAWAGASMVDPVAPGPTRFGIFALGTVAYYPTNNWRVSVGISSLDNYAAVQVGTEYLLGNFELPIAVTGEARLGQDGAIRAMVGLRGYLGPDPHKSLIDRQREDDPADLGTALYGAAGQATLYGDGANGSNSGNDGSPGAKSSFAGSGSQRGQGTGEGGNQPSGVSNGNQGPPPNTSDSWTPVGPEWCITPHYAWDPTGHCYSSDTFEEYFGP